MFWVDMNFVGDTIQPITEHRLSRLDTAPCDGNPESGQYDAISFCL